MKYLVLFLVAISSHAYAEGNLCGEVKSKYRYPIVENNFTKKQFEYAVASLNETDKANAYDYDFYDIESDLMYIKGYMFKFHLKNNPNNPVILKEFCIFLAEEAYLRHE